MPRRILKDIPYSVKGFGSGTANYISVPSSTNWNFGTDDWTIEVGLRTPTYMDTGGTPILIDHQNGGTSGGFELYLDYASNLIRVRMNRNSVNALLTVNTPTLSKGNWHTIIISRIANSHQVYVDGVAVGSPTVDANTMDTVTGALRIGNYPSGTYSCTDAAIARVRINKGYGYTQADVTNSYFNEVRNNTGLVLDLFPKNDTTVTDISGQGLNGTLNGAAVFTKESPSAQTQNVLQWSEDQTKSIYQKPQIQTPIMGQSDPFGGTGAALVKEDGTAGSLHALRQVPPTFALGRVVTYSTFLKAKERTWAAVYGRGGGCGAYINLATGALGTTGGTAFVKARAVYYGDGWYRVGVTYVDDGNPCVAYMATADLTAVYNGDNSSGLYNFGWQLDIGTEMTPYRRVDLVAVNDSPRYVLPNKQNFLVKSNTLNAADWSASEATPTVDGAGPFEGTTAWKLTDSAANAVHSLTQTISATATGDLAPVNFTVWAKKDDLNYIFLLANQSHVAVKFDLNLGVASTPTGSYSTGATATITPVGDGWYECSLIQKHQPGAAQSYGIRLSEDGINTTYIGSGKSVKLYCPVVGLGNKLPPCETTTTPFNEGAIRSILSRSIVTRTII